MLVYVEVVGFGKLRFGENLFVWRFVDCIWLFVLIIFFFGMFVRILLVMFSLERFGMIIDNKININNKDYCII